MINNVSAEQLQKTICEILSSKRAENIESIMVKDKTIVADYFVIASGKSTIHVKTLVDYVEVELKKQGVTPIRAEGVTEGRWAVLDYGDVVLHVFNDEARDFYKLEKLWADENNVIKYSSED